MLSTVCWLDFVLWPDSRPMMSFHMITNEAMEKWSRHETTIIGQHCFTILTWFFLLSLDQIAVHDWISYCGRIERNWVWNARNSFPQHDVNFPLRRCGEQLRHKTPIEFINLALKQASKQLRLIWVVKCVLFILPFTIYFSSIPSESNRERCFLKFKWKTVRWNQRSHCDDPQRTSYNFTAWHPFFRVFLGSLFN